MSFIDKYVTSLFIIKILFIFLAIYVLLLKEKTKINKKNNNKTQYSLSRAEYWKERIEFIFISMMSFLLLYLFNPRENNTIYITNETKLLLFLFGIILLITANWKNFIGSSLWLSKIQHLVH